MAHQYFDDNRDLAHDLKTYETELLGDSFRFTTDSGVFSRDRLDFGSRLLLESTAHLDFPEGPLLDLGCGYGPVGTVLGRFHPERTIRMVDISERALDLAKQNTAMNGVHNVAIDRSSAYDQITAERFAAIFTNPPIRAGKQLVHQFLAGAYDQLLPGGALLVVIQKKQGAPSAKKKMEEVFGQVEEIERKKGYWILLSRK
ncbi:MULTISPECIES: class I SAM-dependent methyltransferase [Aerococcus]|uniref:Class I SAM-dependent methyltransferase n=1 Tax=Aerococcus sanguinicola TaxID=119206 RepID=A0A5N1GH19_9LACT|nr:MULTISPECIES: class I SAM-dependent methyltransferase [Aerococcus]KAA9299616.1 class I SAM-dependent methyltransferase [Aerococcus sanguinicola]MDK6369996.1 class I SAM-dependent methyltransferase [Aerococcus sp. UMB9870]MDK6680530.1 class I SAM-dependent methyltransferase [Aerococcus sp. UMB8608]MDK6687360.1 class I SAM-dependent methyltransferase [Aerococcus sp. UMB8623]MDK6940519.1 class I SAM-dependent methyltransferase [Aerococcus sp. UMB8487]